MRKAHLFALAFFAVTASLAFAQVASASVREHGGNNGQGGGDEGRAVFVQTNELGGNTVVAYTRGADGTLVRSGSYATGGNGGAETGAVVDKLASQGSLAYDAAHQLLFAVNAGSNSLSTFAVDGAKLSLLQVSPSGGAFPSSVAVHGDLVYVLNAGGAGAVQGFRIDGNRLQPLHDGSRALGLANADTPFFLSSPGQVGFSPDGHQLIVTTKASGSSIDVFQVEHNGRLSATPTVNPSATSVPFAFTFDRSGRAVVAEAASSAVTTYTLGEDGTLTNPQSQPDAQAALCWITSAGRFFYVANAGSNTISGYTVAANGQPSLLGTTGIVGHTEAGAIDLISSSDGAFLYAESGGAGTVDEFRIDSDGTLTKLGVINGLPAGLEGIAAS